MPDRANRHAEMRNSGKYDDAIGPSYERALRKNGGDPMKVILSSGRSSRWYNLLFLIFR